MPHPATRSAVSKKKQPERLNVLVVDDQIDLRRLMRLTLEPEGHEVFEAGTGAEALEVAARELPDVVVLDVMMPGDLHGFEVCRRLKADARLSGVHVILLSARTHPVDLDSGREAGADYYLGKPFSPLRLTELVAACGPRARTDLALARETEEAIASWSGVYDLREFQRQLEAKPKD
jgi:DNA-binding response OmpR family regulator